MIKKSDFIRLKVSEGDQESPKGTKSDPKGTQETKKCLSKVQRDQKSPKGPKKSKGTKKVQRDQTLKLQKGTNKGPREGPRKGPKRGPKWTSQRSPSFDRLLQLFKLENEGKID